MSKFESAYLEEMTDDLISDISEGNDLEEDLFMESLTLQPRRMSLSSVKPKAEDGYNSFKCCSSNETLAYLSPDSEPYTEVPNVEKCKEDVGIKDIVKDLALPYLPAKSLCRFSIVSKEWHLWINSPFLAHQQTVRFKQISGLFCQFPGESPSFISLNQDAYGVPCPCLSFLPEPADVRTTCNGLLCCRSRLGENLYIICNPVTKKWRMLPNPKLYHGPETGVALAFEPDVLNFSSHYQLICAVTLPDRAALCFEIYSSRTDSWRHCDAVCCEVEALNLNGDGFYMEGIVYWETESNAVLAFHVNDEEYGMLTLPTSSAPIGAISGLHGELCYLLPRKEDDDDSYTLEVYGNMDMSLKHVIPLNLQLFWSTGMCRILSAVNDDTLVIDLGRDVIAYHLAEHRGQRLSGSRTDGYARYLPYVNSLVNVCEPVGMEEEALYLLHPDN